MESKVRKNVSAALSRFGLSARAMALLVLFAWLFAELADDVWRREGFSWDAPVMLAIHQLSRPWLDALMWWVTQTGSALAVVFLAGLVIWWLYKGKKVEAILFSGSFLGAVSMNYLLKQLFARPRPEVFPPLVVEYTYSFPSGHTIAAVSLYGLLAVEESDGFPVGVLDPGRGFQPGVPGRALSQRRPGGDGSGRDMGGLRVGSVCQANARKGKAPRRFRRRGK